MDPFHASALELARALRERRLGAVELVEAHLAHIERVNPVLNAVVALRRDEALAEARDAERRLSTARPGDLLPPLLGVPCTIKENFALQGMPQSAGLVARRAFRASHDATAVARLRRAGAIPLGSTNLSELCMWMESDNRVYGRCNNPYDPTRIVGGSSGGEGAVVGAAGAPFGLGADVGGSIRGPAFFNGVFGHKPTGGLVPNTGQWPATEGAQGSRYLCTGPLCRRAEDLLPLLRLLAGPDGVDPGTKDFALPDGPVDLAGRTVLLVEPAGPVPVSDDLLEARERAARALERRGARLRRAELPLLRHAFEIWSAMLGSTQQTRFGELLGTPTPRAVARALATHLAGRGPHTLMALLLAATDPLPRLLPELTRRRIEEGRALRAQALELMGEGGLWLHPPYSRTAPPHGQPVTDALLLRFPFALFAIFNVLELPVTQVPLGLDRDGLPLGVQVIGRPGDDAVTIAAARALEEDFGGWVPPPLAP